MQPAIVSPETLASKGSEESSRFLCPSCRGILSRKGSAWECLEEDLLFPVAAGIQDFILPTRKEAINRFLEVYQNLRRREEWGNGSPEFILGLPFKDLTGRHANNWHVRARTYECFAKDLAKVAPPSASVLDLGAGNCWLSIRLSKEGYRVTAVDVNLDERDGMMAPLSVMPHIQSVNLVRAEFGYLPFSNASFDIILFNASLHYSKDPLATLRAVSPILKSGGSLYILDSPVYKREEDGNAMLRERGKEISRLVGREIPKEFSGSFLTFDRIRQLESEYRVQILRPEYGFLWNVRPLVASIFRRRQPAAFMVIRLMPRPESAA